ncbi:acetaldehyde dehydrogenase (acetylating) [bacterium]|nr:acetaldehyde dehydrogenase (acetylating) [bacterium]
MDSSRIRVGVLGSGNIGIDLCERLLDDPEFEVVCLVGRRPDSPGLERFRGRIPIVLSGGIEELLPIASRVEGVFDATSAFDHERHWRSLSRLGVWMVDLTPSRVGVPMVPALIGRVPSMEISQHAGAANYSMVTCGGQSSAPLLAAIVESAQGIREVEVSSSIAALSAGPATRRNVDEYIESTEELLRRISGCQSVKAILVLNPSQPPVMMRTTVTVEADHIDINGVVTACAAMVAAVQASAPGYSVAVAPHESSTGRVVITAKVTGAGYYLPEYAGNLDIINAAAIETARQHARATRRLGAGIFDG